MREDSGNLNLWYTKRINMLSMGKLQVTEQHGLFGSLPLPKADSVVTWSSHQHFSTSTLVAPVLDMTPPFKLLCSVPGQDSHLGLIYYHYGCILVKSNSFLMRILYPSPHSLNEMLASFIQEKSIIIIFFLRYCHCM